MDKKVFITKRIKKNVLELGNLVKEEGVPVSKLIIFGSYAKKKATKYSDIDVCVVSPKFGKDTTDELQFLFKKSRLVDTRIEPYPVSSKEYRTTATPLIYEIKKYGKMVK